MRLEGAFDLQVSFQVVEIDRAGKRVKLRVLSDHPGGGTDEGWLRAGDTANMNFKITVHPGGFWSLEERV